MSRTITAFDNNGGQSSYGIDFPDECPRCHRHVTPVQLTAISRADNKRELEVCFRCTNLKCDSLFLVRYRAPVAGGEFKLIWTGPQSMLEKSFETSITETSPSFVTIYNQALEAETHGLDQIVGIGLRKALEFLIKDFAILQSPNESEEIRKMPLAQVIGKYIGDVNLKNVAERAAWLGNDETHYERIWVEKDIEDLKRLIHLSVNWVDNVITSKQYADSMVLPKKKEKESSDGQ